MTSPTTIPALASLTATPYLTADGQIPPQWQGQVGIYAIYDADQTLQYVGYSRNVWLGLQQHLVRQPELCHWVKIQTVERPSRTLLDSIRDAWIAENGATPPGNGPAVAAWEKPIDAKLTMTNDERTALDAAVGIEETKLLKKLARRIEAEVLERLKTRGAQMDLRFNPKLKEQGLLDLK